MLILWACFIQLTTMLRYHIFPFSPSCWDYLSLCWMPCHLLNWDNSLTFISFIDAENEKILLFLIPKLCWCEVQYNLGLESWGSVYPLENLLTLLGAHFSIFCVWNTPGHCSLWRCSYWHYKHASPSLIFSHLPLNTLPEGLLGIYFIGTGASH